MDTLLRTTVALLLGAALILSGLGLGCGGGGLEPATGGESEGDDGGGGIGFGSPLEGRWLGVQLPVGALWTAARRIEIRVDSARRITHVFIAGVDQRLRGELDLVSPNIYEFTLSDGGAGGFWTDSTQTHAAFLSQGGDFGVLEKGATELPPYGPADVRLSAWRGPDLTVVADTRVLETIPSRFDVRDDFSWHLRGDAGFIARGDTVSFNPDWGLFGAQYTHSTRGVGHLQILMSADKTFIAAHFGYRAEAFPEDYHFFVWTRQ